MVRRTGRAGRSSLTKLLGFPPFYLEAWISFLELGSRGSILVLNLVQMSPCIVDKFMV